MQDSIINTVEKYTLSKVGSVPSKILFVSVKEQKMYHIQSSKIVKTYTISTSKYGEGNVSGSKKTPIGLHKIRQKYGGKTPKNGKLIGRVFYGKIATIYSDATRSKTDDITSRVLWLGGMEKGINKGNNVDSYRRYIYIHGTSEEGILGQKASHGCIRMKNSEVIALYSLIKIGTLVLIL